jgi:hypothetical protein
VLAGAHRGQREGQLHQGHPGHPWLRELDELGPRPTA